MLTNSIVLRRIEGVLLLALSVAFYAQLGFSWWLFAALFFLPDIGIAGYWIDRKTGGATYNLTHWLIWPLLLGAYGLWQTHDTVLMVAVIWAAHLGFDRSLGWGFKTAESFCHTDMGLKKPPFKAKQLQP